MPLPNPHKATQDPLLTLRNVHFAYHSTPVLSHVSLSVQPSEFVGIIGPNGGGKTTLLRLIMGFLKPAAGHVTLFGRPAHHQTDRSQLAYVPQSIRLDRQFPISVFEVVLSGRLGHLPWHGQFSRRDKQAALEALERVNMVSYKDHAFGTLSGGQAQRVLIARALVSTPRLLLLDEPTASVDTQAETDIYALLKELQRQMAIIMVTHDLRAAAEHVQRLVCVQTTVRHLLPSEICEHVAIGLYTSPNTSPITSSISTTFNTNA